MSRELPKVNQGLFYPALHRMKKRGFIDAGWGISGNGRRAKCYRLTRRG